MAYYSATYIASLDQNLKLIDFAELAIFKVINQTDKIFKHTVILRQAYLDKSNLLNFKESYSCLNDVNGSGEPNAKKELSNQGFVFLEDGKAMNTIIY
jgi:hypothetical protein